MSNYVLPFLVLIVIAYGLIKKVPIYDTFISGSKESFSMVVNLFLNVLAMILGVNIFINSGILELFANLFEFVKIPPEIVPLVIVRPISGGAALALTSNILANFGPDSFIGRLVSVIQGSTDTTLYVLTLYFGSVGIKKIRYALKAGLLADLIGIIVAVIVVRLIF